MSVLLLSSPFRAPQNSLELPELCVLLCPPSVPQGRAAGGSGQGAGAAHTQRSGRKQI